jgi:signal transduction histidine kinase
VAADPDRESGHPVPKASDYHRRYAALVDATRAEILNGYENSLRSLRSPLLIEPLAREQALANASEIINDVIESVQSGGVRIDEGYKRIAWTIGETRAESQMSPADSLSAAVALFHVTVTALARHHEEHRELLPYFLLAVLALNESINRRIRESTLAYTAYLLNRVHRAHIDERRRIARELHDRLGEGLSVALRQLELHEIASMADPDSLALRPTVAKEALTEAMRRLRLVTSDLRQEPVTSLEKALLRYLDSVAADADVRLRISGDETWVPPTVLDETFLIIREAIRNALTHAEPQLMLIGVDLAPHELRAWVEDDGRGIVPDPDADPADAGTGIASMRERADLIGGRLTISSAPGKGTHIELHVLLPGIEQ